MTLPEAEAAVLRRYHQTLSKHRHADKLLMSAARFCVANKIMFDDLSAMLVYQAHEARVAGRSSPKDCDDAIRRILLTAVAVAT